MTGDKAKRIIERYNDKQDFVRCPNGRAVVRNELDTYAKAAVNLYGVISRKEFVDIFNNKAFTRRLKKRYMFSCSRSC